MTQKRTAAPLRDPLTVRLVVLVWDGEDLEVVPTIVETQTPQCDVQSLGLMDKTQHVECVCVSLIFFWGGSKIGVILFVVIL